MKKKKKDERDHKHKLKASKMLGHGIPLPFVLSFILEQLKLLLRKPSLNTLSSHDLLLVRHARCHAVRVHLTVKRLDNL